MNSLMVNKREVVLFMRTFIATVAVLAMTVKAPTYLHQNPATTKFVEEFEKTYSVDTYNIIIEFTDTMSEPDNVGECYYAQTPRKILISESYWKTASDTTKKILIFHELGHCALDLQHDETIYPDTCPASIMNPSLMTDKCFSSHAEDMIEALDS